MRSLNLSNAVAIVAYEALRQLGYPGLYEKEPDLLAMVANEAREAVKREAQRILMEILPRKRWKIGSRGSLNSRIVPAVERVLLSCVFIFALRKILNLDIPIVLDSPYVIFDQELRRGLSDFLKAQPCQQILLGFEHEFSEEETPKYILMDMQDYSKVMEY